LHTNKLKNTLAHEQDITSINEQLHTSKKLLQQMSPCTPATNLINNREVAHQQATVSINA